MNSATSWGRTYSGKDYFRRLKLRRVPTIHSTVKQLRSSMMWDRRQSILSPILQMNRSNKVHSSFTLLVSRQSWERSFSTKSVFNMHWLLLILPYKGIMYAFLGISLATQDYINPSIDIIKKKGVVSTISETDDQITYRNVLELDFLTNICSV